MLLWAPQPTPMQVKVVKFTSTSIQTLEALLRPLYAEGWRAAVYGNGFLILEKP